jgi:hypothetical protein
MGKKGNPRGGKELRGVGERKLLSSTFLLCKLEEWFELKLTHHGGSAGTGD